MALVQAFKIDPNKASGTGYAINICVNALRKFYVIPYDVMQPPPPVITKNKTRAWAYFSW